MTMNLSNSNPRPKFEDIFMDLALSVAKRATCCRLQVGTVITSTDYRKVLSIGYNGNASGLHNGCDRDTPGNCGCLHAEQNSVINCDAPRGTDKIVFVTHVPCQTCGKFLINLGNVKKVYYANAYRDTTSLSYFDQVGIAHEYYPRSSK